MPVMDELDWSDLRYALAIGVAGSLAAAARQMRVNHTTVLRRLDALEQRLGARLFERTRSGYRPTEAGALVLEQARRMADQADAIERRVLGRDRELTGLLRVTTAYVVMEHLLPQPLAQFARAFPGIEVEVVENAVLVDLSRQRADESPAWVRREADVAVRLSTHVAEHLVGRQLGQTQCRVYACRGAPDLPQSVQPLSVLLREAVLEAGAVRCRPIALTAAAVVIGGLVMVLDPIFQGLAVALMSGAIVATLLTMVVVPLLYWELRRREGATS